MYNIILEAEEKYNSLSEDQQIKIEKSLSVWTGK